MSSLNFSLSGVEHEKKFITLGPGNGLLNFDHNLKIQFSFFFYLMKS